MDGEQKITMRTGRPRRNRVGDKIGRMTVIAQRWVPGDSILTVICECGTQKTVCVANLKKTVSCGCFGRERTKDAATKHGMFGTPTYESWGAMKGRCLNPGNRNFVNYGQRGIRICAHWMTFENFYADMGERPVGLTLERKNNDGGYTCGHCEECTGNNWPANCRWATRKEQANNRRPMKPRAKRAA